LSDPTFWIVSRAAGISAYLFVTAAVLAGLLLKARPFGTRLKPATVTDLHRFIALLALAATVLHGGALALDSKRPAGLQALLLPGVATYRPLWTGLGVLAAEVMFAIYLSFPLRRLIGTRTWRRLHWLTYPVFAAVTIHGVMTGSDAGRQWTIDLYVSATGAVAAATAWRVLVPARRRGSITAATERRDAAPASDQRRSARGLTLGSR
jgi:DMSO/TMAO reductase YedYZ heme-binding membrane subunit